MEHGEGGHDASSEHSALAAPLPRPALKATMPDELISSRSFTSTPAYSSVT